jgi:hypothetical protein
MVLMMVRDARFHRRSVLATTLPRLGFKTVIGMTKSEVKMMFLFQSIVRPWGENCSLRMFKVPAMSFGHSAMMSKFAFVSTRRPGDVPTAAVKYQQQLTKWGMGSYSPCKWWKTLHLASRVSHQWSKTEALGYSSWKQVDMGWRRRNSRQYPTLSVFGLNSNVDTHLCLEQRKQSSTNKCLSIKTRTQMMRTIPTSRYIRQPDELTKGVLLNISTPRH